MHSAKNKIAPLDKEAISQLREKLKILLSR